MKKTTLVLIALLSFMFLVSCSAKQSKPVITTPVAQTHEEIKVDNSISENQNSIEKPRQLENQVVKEEQKQEATEEPKKVEEQPLKSSEKVNTNESQSKIYYTGRAVVLTYHHFSLNPASPITVKPERFEGDLKMLKENNFNVISLKDMIKAMEGNGKLPPNAVVITIDDGYESVYKYAYPLLRKYNMPATTFVITSWIEGDIEPNKEYGAMNEGQVREMYKSGLMDIQSHSNKGHDYIVRNEKGDLGGMLAFQKYDKKTKAYETEENFRTRVVEDLKISIPLIEKYTDTKPDAFCFPFGHYNSRLVELSKEAGFKYFITTGYGYNKEGSKSIMIKRIRSGDTKLTPEKLKTNIIECGKGKPAAS
jgi:biofilm PGA synthesis lipoprotein PgaB